MQMVHVGGADIQVGVRVWIEVDAIVGCALVQAEVGALAEGMIGMIGVLGTLGEDHINLGAKVEVDRLIGVELTIIIQGRKLKDSKGILAGVVLVVAVATVTSRGQAIMRTFPRKQEMQIRSTRWRHRYPRPMKTHL